MKQKCLTETVTTKPYKDVTCPVEKRIEDLLPRMTLEEKVSLLSGSDQESIFKSKGNSRLGIPEMVMTDGPLGPNNMKKSTHYGSTINMAATFDEALIREVGESLGEETRVLGFNMLLGPCINIARVPHGGRTFESFSEDPHLTARMAVAYVKGVQSKRVISCTKHFACNNQEWNRFDVNVDVDERTLREIYFPAFRAVVQEADGWTVMAAYNQVNGHYCCENKFLLTDILKNEWGFKGLAVSDWCAIKTTLKTAEAGLDLEMPTALYFGNDLLEAVKRGQLKESVIDDKVRRMLYVLFRAGLFDESVSTYGGIADTPERRSLALKVAQKSIVLLKNEDHFLPIDKNRLTSIAVIGPNANVVRTGGGGSAYLVGHYGVSPLQGIKNKLGENCTVLFASGTEDKRIDLPVIESTFFVQPGTEENKPGLKGEYFKSKRFEGKPVLTRIDQKIDFTWHEDSLPGEINKEENFSVRWTGTFLSPGQGLYEIGVKVDNNVRLFLDDKIVVDSWTNQALSGFRTVLFDFQAGREYDIRIESWDNRGSCECKCGLLIYDPESAIQKAVEFAEKAEIAVVCVGCHQEMEGEEKDRDSLNLPSDQIDLIKAVSAKNKKCVIVLNNGTSVLMQDWFNSVPAIIDAFYPGQEGGNALADILFGDVSPSGKLPMTFLQEWQDSPVANSYPGEKQSAHYTEGLYVGYRYFDKKNIEPLFPFGHGLSFTDFEYNNLQIDPNDIAKGGHAIVTLTVHNIGHMEGDDVVQLYVRDIICSVDRPVKELKAFTRVSLKPEEKRTIRFRLDKTAFEFYDINTHDWIAEPGEFEILVGRSSRDIRLNDIFEL